MKKAKLKELAAKAGLYPVGVTGAAPLDYMLERLNRRISENRTTAFEEQNPARRISPEALLPGCRSIVVLGLPYDIPVYQHPGSAGARGEVARCARILDYHLVLEHKTKLLEKMIKKEEAGKINSRIMVDRSPLLEKELAFRAGLGVIGENCTLITAAYGSFVALGTLLLDRELDADNPGNAGCQRCGACREACPTGALEAPYILNPARCLSYLTQIPGIVPVEFRPYFGRRLYGCDLCQEVCPENRSIKKADPENTGFTFFPAEPLLKPLLRITQKEFSQTIGLSAAGWRGKTTCRRNALIALGNSGDRSAVPAPAEILQNDPKPLLRLHAAWALGRLGGAQARRHLENCLTREPDSSVRQEAAAALATLPSP